MASTGTKGSKRTIAPFWWLAAMLFIVYPPFLRPWWWVFAPFFLVIELRALYLWWIAWDFAYAKTKWVMLEIVPPKELLVPLKAMEDIFSMMWGPLVDFPNFREVWCEGILPDCPGWMSFEIVSIEGKIHFLARVQQAHRLVLETSLYNYYPELEIHEVTDYMKDVPKSIPNEEWDLYGEDFILKKPAAYPIKTYEKFFEPQGEKITAEEKRIDPINSLLEAMSNLGPGEQYWAQFIMHSTANKYDPEFKKGAEEALAKLTKRPIKKQSTWTSELINILHDLLFGPTKVGSGETATYKWSETAAVSESGEREMLLTPGERETVTEIENKSKKPIFRTTLRGVYIAKRENWKPASKTLLRAYLGHFNTEHLNQLSYDKYTRTKVHYLFRKRRVYLRARRILKNAMLRFPPYFPNRKRGCVVLGPEELATLFHFPVKMTGMIVPTMGKVQAKKSGPPPNLPIE